MADRFCYLDKWERIQESELKGGLKYSSNIAKKKEKLLTVLVNSINNCDQIVEKIFEKKICNKLKRGEVVKINGVNIRLRSPKSIDDNVDHGVLFCLHSSPEAIQKIEANRKLDTVVLFSENALHLDKWKQDNNVRALERLEA